MAKRSDFAQKLLDDLRLRKERMGLAQATQRPEPRATADAHDSSRWSFRGSAERTSTKTSGKQMLGTEITQKNRSARYSRIPTPEAASKEIVPVTRAGGPKQTMDLSRGLTIAFSYGGKNLNWDLYSGSSNKGFILKQTSVDFSRRENRHQPSTVPYVSQIHIEEISKCAQKLNEILRACSSGLHFDRESINIGRELLKGAIDLEESLRMLASLQEASEKMVKLRRKQVRLLNEKEDEDEPSTAHTEQQMILSRPRLTLYGTQWSLEEGRQQGQKALVGIDKPTSKPKSVKHTDESMKISYHRKSAGSSPSFKPGTPFSAIRNDSYSEKVRTSSDSKAFMQTASTCNTSNHTNDTRQPVPQVKSGHEKARIPNVIAKLMGLEDLPPSNTESKKSGTHKVSLSMHGTRTTTNLRPNSQETKGAHMAALVEKPAMKMEVKRNVSQDKESAMARATKSVEAVKSKDKANLKVVNTENPLTKGSEKPLKDVRRDADGKGKILLQKEHRAINEMGMKGKENEAKVELILKERQDSSFNSRTAISIPDRHPHNEQVNQEFPGRVQNAQTDDVKGSPILISQLKHTHDDRPKQPNAVQRSESPSKASKEQNVKNESELADVRRSVPTKNTNSIHEIRSERLVSKSTSAMVSNRKSTRSVDKKQVKNSLKSSHLENMTVRSTKAVDHQFDKKSANGTELGRHYRADSKSKKQNVRPLVPTCRSIPSTRTEQNKRTGQSENRNAGRNEEDTTGSQSPSARNPQVKQHISIFQEMTHGRESNSRAGDEILSLPPPEMEQYLPEKAQDTSHCDMPVKGDQTMTKGNFGETSTDTECHETIIPAAPDQQPSEISIREDQDPCFLDLFKNPVPESADSRLQHTSDCNSFRLHDKAVSKINRRELLTDDENNLREILVKSQLFLNNAQALFHIQIPVSTTQAGKTESCEQSKITLDCGYEVMRRKGKREERTLLSPMKIWSATVKVRCLDDLIRELDNDLKILKFPCLNEGYLDTSECLHKMIERDIHDSNPDVNCMWDSSWNSLMFASPEKNEVIRDVEKHVLNGLINDIVKDLLSVSISA